TDGAAPRPAPAPRDDDREILPALSRLTFGPRPADLERVRALGLQAWIERQLRPETIDDAATERALADLASLRMSIPEALRAYPRPDPRMREKLESGQLTRQDMLEMYPPEKRPARLTAELQAAKVLRAVTGERQLHEVMVDFWFNHFNVFAGKGDVRWYVAAYERDAIRPRALGKFPDLVRATARHPAMLFYLDNWLSAREDFVVAAGPNRGRRAGLNENYARELMELHTLGVDGGYTRTDGDVKAMLRTIVEAPEFWSEDAYRAKVKTPLEFVASAVRALSASVDARGAFELARASAEVGQPLYQAEPPTGYRDTAEAWVNTGALLARNAGVGGRRAPGGGRGGPAGGAGGGAGGGGGGGAGRAPPTSINDQHGATGVPQVRRVCAGGAGRAAPVPRPDGGRGGGEG